MPRGGDVVFDDDDEDEAFAVTRRGRARGELMRRGLNDEEVTFAMARMKND